MKRSSRVSVCLLSVGLGCTLPLAQPVLAATSVTWSGSAASPSSLTDDSFTVTSTSGSRIFISSSNVQGPGGLTCNTNSNRIADCEIPAGSSKTFTILPATVAQTVQFNDSGSMFANTISTMTVTYRQTPAPQGATSVPTPASILQQVGQPPSGRCTEVTSDEHNWGGVGHGGWSESWAQWMNSGNGGAVCTRTLVYSSNLGTWTVG